MEIMYLVGDEPNDAAAESQGDARTRGLLSRSSVPEDPDTVYEIYVDGSFLLSTDNAAGLGEEAAWMRWHLLAGERKPPAGLGVRTAVVFAEAIWIGALGEAPGYSDEKTALAAAFLSELGCEADKRMGGGKWGDGATGWEELAKAGLAQGVDFRIDAWIAGAPLEAVLAG